MNKYQSIESSKYGNCYLPNQHTNIKEKNNPEWYKAVYDYFITRGNSEKDSDTIARWLDAANGIVNTESLNYLTSPLKAESGQEFVFPGRLRDTDLINTVREKNLGEYVELPYKYQVTVNNEDSLLKRDIEVNAKILDLAKNRFANLIKDFQDTTQEQKKANIDNADIPDFEKIYKLAIQEWVDDRAITGQNILDLIYQHSNFDHKRLTAFFYWWATEEFYTYREVVNDEIEINIINPLNAFPIRNGCEFNEDFDAFVIKNRVTLDEVEYKYKDDLSDEELNYLKTGINTKNGGMYASSQFLRVRNAFKEQTNPISSTDDIYITSSNDRFVDEYKIIWRTEVPIKIITIFTGSNFSEVVLDDSNKHLKELAISSRTEWIEQVWIGTRIGDDVTGIYTLPKPCTIQRYDNITGRVKLPVGGKIGILPGIRQNPVPNRLVPYVLIDQLLTLAAERAIAKYQDHITIIPLSILKNDNAGTYKEKMFYLKADGNLIYDDRNGVDLQTVAQGFRTIQGSPLGDYLMTILRMKQQYKAEALEMSNMNPERMGQIDPNAGKGITEQNVYRAKLGSLLMITTFNSALQRDHQADLAFTQALYDNDFVGTIYNSKDGKTSQFVVNIEQHKASQYLVFVRNSKLEDRAIQAYQDLAFSAAQNGEFELAAHAIEADTLPEVRKVVKDITDATKRMNASIEEQRNATQRYIVDKNAEVSATQNQLKIELAKMEYTKAIDVANITTNGVVLSSGALNKDETPNFMQDETDDIQREKLDIQREMLDETRNNNNRNFIMKLDSNSKDRYVAKTNKNKYDSK